MKKYIGFLIVLSVLVGFSQAEATTLSIKRGAKSNEVKSIQSVLKSQGYGISADGVFGVKTENAIKKFQAAKGIPATGIIDANTKSLIVSIVSTGAVAVPQIGKIIPEPVVSNNNINPLPPVVTNLSDTTVTVMSPNSGETWTKGTTQAIVWKDTSSTVVSKTYDINLVNYYTPCVDRCPLRPIHAPYTIAQKVTGSSYNWRVGDIVSSTADMSAVDGLYQIQVCVSGTDTCDSSDNYFTVNSAGKEIIPLPVVANTSPTASCLGPVVSKNTSYANQTTAPNIQNYKIGSFNIQNNCFNESVRVTNLKVGLNQNSSAVPIGDLTNLIIKDYANSVLTTSIQPSYNNNIAVDFIIPAGQAYVVNIYSNIGSTPTGTAQTNLGYNAVGMTTNVSYPTASSINPVVGQIITIGQGVPVGNNSY